MIYAAQVICSALWVMEHSSSSFINHKYFNNRIKYKHFIISGGTHLFTGANGLRRRGRQTYTRYVRGDLKMRERSWLAPMKSLCCVRPVMLPFLFSKYTIISEEMNNFVQSACLFSGPDNWTWRCQLVQRISELYPAVLYCTVLYCTVLYISDIRLSS